MDGATLRARLFATLLALFAVTFTALSTLRNSSYYSYCLPLRTEYSRSGQRPKGSKGASINIGHGWGSGCGRDSSDQLRDLRSCSRDSPSVLVDGIHLFSYLFLGRSCRSFPAEILAKTSKLRSPRCICKPFDDVRMIWSRGLWIWWDEARLSMRRAKLMAPPGIFMFYMPAVESEGPTSPYSIARSWHTLWSTRSRPQGSYYMS